jgi:hypothetical protein
MNLTNLIIKSLILPYKRLVKKKIKRMQKKAKKNDKKYLLCNRRYSLADPVSGFSGITPSRVRQSITISGIY